MRVVMIGMSLRARWDATLVRNKTAKEQQKWEKYQRKCRKVGRACHEKKNMWVKE